MVVHRIIVAASVRKLPFPIFLLNSDLVVRTQACQKYLPSLPRRQSVIENIEKRKTKIIPTTTVGFSKPERQINIKPVKTYRAC